MPLVKGDTSGNIRELIRAGHPQKQAVAIALRLEGRRGKKKVKLSREDEEALWPHVNDETHRLILADVLEENGDPLHHVLRNLDPKGMKGITALAPITYSHPAGNLFMAGKSGQRPYKRVAIGMGKGYVGHTLVSHPLPDDVLDQINRHHGDGKLELSRPNVIAEANSQSQDIRKFIATKIAKEARLKLVNLLDARSQDNAGLVQSYEAPGDEAGVDYAAAWYGMLTNQPSVTTFHENPQGPDTFYKWRVAGDADEALKTLPPGTFVDKDGWAHYLDKGSQHPMDGISGARGTAMTMQGRGAYRDFIKRYQGPDETQDSKVTLAANSSVIVKVPLPQPVLQKKPVAPISYILPV